MADMPTPPKAYTDFIERFPQLGAAWDTIHEAGSEGPLDPQTVRLIKLGIAMGAMRRGAVRSSVRKGKALGITDDAFHQALALSAGTLGMPSTVALYTWIEEALSGE